jgi:hypothetical protein
MRGSATVIEPANDDLERAFGHAVTAYDVEPIDPHLRIHSVTGGVYRVRVGSESLVVKIVRHGVDATPDQLWQSGPDASHRNYWKREWLAFDSGLLDALPGQLRAPQTLLTTQHDDGDCWIWMQDVRGRTGSALRLDDYAAIARALGSTQGAYASDAVPLPDEPWLSWGWLRGWVDLCAQFVATARDDARWTGRRLEPLRPLRWRMLALWDRRDELLAIASEPPMTISHWDFWPTNLFVSEAGAVTAIDWSQVGRGGVTHDLDQITLDPVWMHVRPDVSLDVLEALVLTAYTDGLRDSGFDISLTTARRWYSAAAALRYAFLAGTQVDLVEDPECVQFSETRFGRDMATINATKARVVAHALDLGEHVLAG